MDMTNKLKITYIQIRWKRQRKECCERDIDDKIDMKNMVKFAIYWHKNVLVFVCEYVVYLIQASIVTQYGGIDENKSERDDNGTIFNYTCNNSAPTKI